MKVLEKRMVKALDSFIDDTLNKVNGVNKPFKAIRRTDEYKKFDAMFTDAINQQGTQVADNLKTYMDSAGIDDNLEPLTLDQEQRLKGIIAQNMPPIDTYVTQNKIFLDTKGFFEWAVVQQYKRWGYVAKSDAVDFTLSNQQYINKLKDRANFLLNKSSLDDTTLDDIISTISDNRLAGMTNGEVSQMLRDNFDVVSRARGDMIARTEAANAMGSANYASAKENGAPTHSWIGAGNPDDELCQGNVDDGEIPIDQPFSSGDLSEPAHPNCECYTEAGEIDLDSINLWTGE